MTTSRATARQLAVLRTQWRMWRRNQHPHPDFRLVCPAKCGDCEACAMTAYRADRLDAIKAEALTLAGAT